MVKSEDVCKLHVSPSERNLFTFLFHFKLGCIHYVLPGGEEDFWGGYKNFQDEIGGIGNFQLIYRGGCQISP